MKKIMVRTFVVLFVGVRCGTLLSAAEEAAADYARIDSELRALSTQMEQLKQKTAALLLQRSKLPVTTTSRDLYFEFMKKWMTPIGVNAQIALISHVQGAELCTTSDQRRTLVDFLVLENQIVRPIVDLQYGFLLDNPKRLINAMGYPGLPEPEVLEKITVFNFDKTRKCKIVLGDLIANERSGN